MNRNLISKIIIALLILFIAFLGFWFFKTSAIKKQITSYIKLSTNISSSSISIFGFPFEQNIVIKDLKFDFNSRNPTYISLPELNNNFQINIGKITASGKIYSNQFTINDIENVTIRHNYEQETKNISFNQKPEANFIIIDGNIVSFSYKDSGYKIVDDAQNIFFANGKSNIEFASIKKNDNYHNNLKINFSDSWLKINILDDIYLALTKKVGKSEFAPSEDPKTVPKTEETAENTQNIDQSVNKEFDSDSDLKIADLKNVEQEENIIFSEEQIMNKDIALDVSYIMPLASLEMLDPNNINSDKNSPTIVSKLTSFKINNFNISSPIYKINVSGELKGSQDSQTPVSNFVIRTEGIEKLLTSLKNTLSNKTSDSENETEQTNQEAGKPSAENISDEEEKVKLVELVIDLARRNSVSNDQISVFDISISKDNSITINDLNYKEIFPYFFDEFNEINNEEQGLEIKEEIQETETLDEINPEIEIEMEIEPAPISKKEDDKNKDDLQKQIDGN